MNIEQLRNYCITKKGVTESFPFDETTLVFKVMNKIFLLTGLNGWEQGDGAMNVKCNPALVIELRQQYKSVLPGFHMSKKHWNTVQLTTGEISDDLAKEFINHSYDLVVQGLTKKQKKPLKIFDKKCLQEKSYIGHQLLATGTKKYQTINPKLNKVNSTNFIEATSEEINEAVQLAEQAFYTLRTISDKQKALFLETIAKEILVLDEELLNTYCQESGLSKERAIGERTRTLNQLCFFADLLKEGSWVEASIDTGLPERTPNPKPDIRKLYIGLGPVVVFGASNFPLAYSTAGGDTAAALAAGCPVVIKSHPMHAGTGELVASAIIKAAIKTNMPNGIFSNLNSSGIEVGVQLVQHPKVKAVGFTGSIRGGRALYDLASKREEPIPVFAEMGSINPVVILPKSLKKSDKNWAKIYADSITLDVGQFCTNPGLILTVKSTEITSFIQQLTAEIIKKEAMCMLHPTIKYAFTSAKEMVLSQEGVTLAATKEPSTQPNCARQVIATVDGAIFLQNTRLHQEVFGPFSLVVQCKNMAELELVIHQLEGQLTGTIIADQTTIKNYTTIIMALQNRVGRLIFNGVPTGVEVCSSMTHGGPYPASTDSRFTAVGVHSIKRWVRPFSYQNFPDHLLPDALKNSNPLQILRRVNNRLTKKKI